MAQDFITRFQGITGESVGERQRNVNHLLKNVSLTNEEQQFVLDNLNPKTYLEKLFYIDVLIEFKETGRLLKIFKEGNGAFVSKIMKQPWFFKEVFQNISPSSLVTEFLPMLSFCSKIKLLKSLSGVYTEEVIDEVFDYVVNRYGLFMADPVITACSSNKIAFVLMNYKIKLSTHQLKTIHRKDLNLIKIYLEEQKQYSNKSIFDNNFMKYLAEKNPVYFWELIEQYKCDENLKLGRRITKKLVSIKTREIVNDPEKYIKYLRHETLVRRLNKQGNFKQVYYNLFPRKIEKLHGNALCRNILKYYPKKDRYNLYINTFNEVMKDDIWQHTSCMRDNFLESFTNVEARQAWAETRYKESGNEDFFKFYEMNKAIELIKEKIDTTSCIKNRSKLVSLLVQCCGVKKDLNSLGEVLKYFCMRHKNDDRNLRSMFLETIENNFDLKKFTATHWSYVGEILMILGMKEEYDYFHTKFRIQHINYLFNNNGSEEDIAYFVLEYVKEQLQCYSLNFDGLDDVKSPEVQKIILLKATEQMDVFIKNQRTEFDTFYIKSQLVARIFWYNTTYPTNPINIQENNTLVQFFKNIPEEQYISDSFRCQFFKVICKLNRNDFENELVNLYFNNKALKQYTFDKVVWWYLKHDPLIIVHHFDKIMEALSLKSHKIWNRIKRYSHLSLDEKIIQRCVNLLGDDEYDQKSQMVPSLSVLQDSESYVKTMEHFNLIPTSAKVDVKDPEVRNLYHLQKTFLRNLRHGWNPLSYLPLLINTFCQGDFLRESLTPLRAAFHQIPENTLEFHLNKLTNNKAMSVKKHGLFLARYIFPQKKVSQIFDSFQVYQNESLQKCLCQSSLRYFFKVQTQEYFERFVSNLKFIKVFDTESLELFLSVQVPKNYKPYYLINFWNLLEELKANPNAVGFNKLMSKVLGNIDKQCFLDLPDDFCKAIINNYFGKVVKKEEAINNIFEFIIKFLMYHKNQTDNLHFVFKLLSNYKSGSRILNKEERRAVQQFFMAFFTLASKDDVDLEFVVKFSAEWEKLFAASDTFKEHILLNLLKLEKDVKYSTELYPKQIVHFAEEVNNKYGEFVFSKFISIIDESCISRKKDKDIIDLLTAMLKYKTSTLNCILVMELLTLKGDLFYNNKINPVYREIDSILKQATDSKVQLCYILFSKNPDVNI